MIFFPADRLSLILFVIFSGLMLASLVFALQKAKAALKYERGLALYLIAFSAIVGSGLALKYIVPVAPILFLSVIFLAILLGASSAGRAIAFTFSLPMLVGFQAFRLPLEIILHHWAEIRTVPETMTWTGQNWDIITGIVSLLACPFVGKSRVLAWATQIIGIALLINVIRVVILSSPLPFAWPLENPLQLIFYLPYALIGPLFVGMAIFGHWVTVRKLLAFHSHPPL